MINELKSFIFSEDREDFETQTEAEYKLELSFHELFQNEEEEKHYCRLRQPKIIEQKMKNPRKFQSEEVKKQSIKDSTLEELSTLIIAPSMEKSSHNEKKFKNPKNSKIIPFHRSNMSNQI